MGYLKRLCFGNDCSELKEVYTKHEVDEIIANLETSSYEIVEELPEVGQGNIIYLVPRPGGGYQQWVYSNDDWIDLGSTTIDLSDYVRKDAVADMIHPIGDTVVRTDNVDPGSIYDGTTWQLISQGRMLIGANSDYPLGSTGGEATHTLTTAQMPSHTHTQNSHNHTQNAHNHGMAHRHYLYNDNTGEQDDFLGAVSAIERKTIKQGTGTNVTGVMTCQDPVRRWTGTDSSQANTDNRTATNNAQTATNQNTGGGQAHNNMPPYLAVNIWLRTA